MKIQVCETVSVDIETTVDVSTNDVLMEFSRRLEEAEINEKKPSAKMVALPLLDFATRMMERIPDSVIADCTDLQRGIVGERLTKELKRWNPMVIQ